LAKAENALKFFPRRSQLLSLAAALLSVLAITATGRTAVPDEPAASERVGTLQEALLRLDREHPAASDRERFRQLEELISSTHDLRQMARFVLAAAWNDLDAAQRERFIELFSQLSIASYAERFRDLGDERFEFRGERELRGGRLEIRSALVSADGSEVNFIYVLQHSAEGGWRIINVLADGVSELALQRADYRQILSVGSFSDLESFIRQRSELID